ncbi:CPBP family intramembrane glutamic endopeptidase [Pseudobutyrivibrio xylanivorans]|uniref:CPBP family intramembrane metalloprotease n=1 Tax=Pseudobutyrivibrio xylanivorans TaxID=185007 RepID=A0A5P6VUU8_PSEXY|nr:CPBP family intramembrane glutamic endopeptidase [Pseudobutyrivibrio xylanivorans]QFJ56426.1 CPBP family intramembrane metalloprotease [Pseudobutyrivibrio xylanivorans]
MKRTKAISIYIAGAIGQIAFVCLVVYLLRNIGFTIDYISPLGMIAIVIGGISSALWGIIVSLKYRKITFKTIVADFFKFKQSYKDYLLVLLFLFIDFLPVILGGEFIINSWYIPLMMFVKHIAFGGLEEIGWRYFYQPALQEKLNYIYSTLITFVSWSIWHFLYFYIEGTIADVSVVPFLIGLLTNSFILSALYVKTKNLWLCVMTHSLINVLSPLAIGGVDYLGYVSKLLIIIMAIRIAYISDKKL